MPLRLSHISSGRAAERLQELADVCFPSDDVVWEGCQWWVISDGKRPVAFAGACAEGDGSHVFLYRAGVDPQYRGLKLQRRLIRAREAWARSREIRTLVTYTSPKSVASMRTLIRCGYLPYTPLMAEEVIRGNFIHWRKDL